MPTPPPSSDDLEATVAMPRVTPPPPPHRRVIDPAVVEPARAGDQTGAAPPPGAPPPPHTQQPPPYAQQPPPHAQQPPPHAQQPPPYAQQPPPYAQQPPPYAQQPPYRQPPPRGGPVYGTVIPPNARVATDRARYDFGHPFGYVCARFFAFALDVGLVSFVLTLLAYSFIAINPITGLPTNSQRGFDATLAIGVVLALVYVWIAEAAFGTTVGKLALGLHVFAVRGGPVGLGRAFLRGLLRAVDIAGIGGLLALLPSHRRLGDFAGGTVVARRTWRGFGPVAGWILVLIIAGLPFALMGLPRTFASLVACWEFLPGLVARVLLWPHTIWMHLPVAH